MSEAVIHIRHLSKFIQNKAIVVDMSLEIPKGSLFGLLGPNGAGKSTTIKLLTGNLKPTSGVISVLGMDPWKNRVEMFRHVGYLPQNPTHYRDLTVFKFITYMTRLKGYKGQSAALEGRRVLAKVGLERFERRMVGKLSGGEQQRLGFANCLIGDPEILILDEPTASLDPEGRVYIMELISQLSHDKSQTVVVSSHILPEIQRMTNHIAIMSEGKVLVTGSMRELTENVFDNEYEIETSHPNELFNILTNDGYVTRMENKTIIVETGNRKQELWSEIPKICNENGYELRSFKPVRDALENVFLNFVSKRQDILEVNV